MSSAVKEEKLKHRALIKSLLKHFKEDEDEMQEDEELGCEDKGEDMDYEYDDEQSIYKRKKGDESLAREDEDDDEETAKERKKRMIAALIKKRLEK